MYTIINNNNYEYFIKKSRFITCLRYVCNEKEVVKAIDDIKKLYDGANHYCYAYIVGNTMKCSDDGEPNGTAGVPILDVLKRKNVNYILCVVVRYFGGIKLGGSGLFRAYSNSVSSSILNNNLCQLKLMQELVICFSYENCKEIDYIVKECTVSDKKYGNNITYRLLINKDLCDDIVAQLKNKCLEISYGSFGYQKSISE